MSPTDLGAVLALAQNIEPNPSHLALRMLGFSSSDAKAGVPTWAWVSLMLGAGVGLGIFLATRYPEVRGRAEALLGGD